MLNVFPLGTSPPLSHALHPDRGSRFCRAQNTSGLPHLPRRCPRCKECIFQYLLCRPVYSPIWGFRAAHLYSRSGRPRSTGGWHFLPVYSTPVETACDRPGPENSDRLLPQNPMPRPQFHNQLRSKLASSQPDTC